MYSLLYINVVVVIIKYTLAKFAKGLSLINPLIDVWLHEKGKCFSGDVLHAITCTHADTMGGRP